MYKKYLYKERRYMPSGHYDEVKRIEFLDRLYDFVQYYGITYEKHYIKQVRDIKILRTNMVYNCESFILHLNGITEQSILVFNSLEETFKKYVFDDIFKYLGTEYYDKELKIHFRKKGENEL